MREILRKVKDYPNYKVSNKGYVINVKTNLILKPSRSNKKYSRQYQICLSNNGKAKSFNLAKLVLNHFTRKQLHKESAKHLDFNTTNNRVTNLEHCTRGDLLRHYKLGKKRGVYKYTVGHLNYYRAMLLTKDGVYKTLGYSKKKKDMVQLFRETFKQEYNYYPY